MPEQHVPDSPFWKYTNQIPREFPELLSDSWYFREFCKGLAEQLTPEDWQRLYRVLRVGVITLLKEKGLETNGLQRAFQLGLIVGKAMRTEMFDK